MSVSSTNVWTPVRWAENEGVRLAYDRLVTGGDGEPLLLIMGLGASRQWIPDGLCETLAAQGFAVARYDQRDAGESTHLPPTATGNPSPRCSASAGPPTPPRTWPMTRSPSSTPWGGVRRTCSASRSAEPSPSASRYGIRAESAR